LEEMKEMKEIENEKESLTSSGGDQEVKVQEF
jgi:hypothetical protein